MPPAYPAPSPAGYNPFKDMLSKFSFLVILTGADVLVSIPVKIASLLANPFILLSKLEKPSFNESTT